MVLACIRRMYKPTKAVQTMFIEPKNHTIDNKDEYPGNRNTPVNFATTTKVKPKNDPKKLKIPSFSKNNSGLSDTPIIELSARANNLLNVYELSPYFREECSTSRKPCLIPKSTINGLKALFDY